MASDIRSKTALLRELGYGGDPDLAEVVLQESGLSNPRKSNIHVSKTDAVREALTKYFLLVCARGDCRQEAAEVEDGRAVVPASEPRHCEFCGGSANQRAVEEMLRACRKRGWTRLCVVGGSPNARSALTKLVGRDLDLKLVDGTQSRHKTQADSDLAWADVVVIWGADAGAANPTLSWPAGGLAVERADVVRTEVQVTGWPLGMDRWSPEQIPAFIQARGAGGNPGGVGDMFYSRQDVKVGADQRGGSGSATNEVPVSANADLSGAAIGAARAAGQALGLGGAAGAGGTKPPPAPADGPSGGK